MFYSPPVLARDDFATALLPTAKEQMRVEFTRDDNFIKGCIIRATDMMERFSGARIFPATTTWTPIVVGDAWAYQVPLQPIKSFTAFADSVEVSAAYALRSGSEVEPVYLVRLDQTAFHAGLSVELVAGYAAADVPPMYLDPILRMAAHLYEHRESVDATNLMTIPQWANDLLCGTWIPRC